MSTTDFDLAAAKTAATTETNKDLTLAAGGASNTFDEIVKALATSTKLTPTEKIEAQRRLFDEGEKILSAIINGRLHDLPAGLLGSGSPAPSSDTETADLQDDFDKAVEQNTKLKGDRAQLERIVLDLGLTAPASENDHFPADTSKRVKDKVQEKVDASAAAAAAAPEDMTLNSEMLPVLTEAKTAVSNLTTSRTSKDIDGKDVVIAKIDAAIAKVS